MKLPAQIFYVRLLLALAGGLFCAALTLFQLVQPLDRMAYDIFNEISPVARADDIVIVAIDERSLRELGRWPWAREKHVELLRQLRSAGAAAVGMDILFAEGDPEYPEVDALLAEAIAAHGAVVLPVFIAQDTRGGQLHEVAPISLLADAAAGLGHVHIEVDSDGVARSVFLREGLGQPRWDHLAVVLSRVLGQVRVELPGAINPDPVVPPDPTLIARNYQNLIPFMGPAGTVDTIPYVDVMRGRLPAESLRGKIALVGATAAGHVDNITTSLGQISGVEINANILHALRTDRFARPLSRRASGLVIFLIAAVTILAFTRMAPKQLLLAVLSSALLLPLVSFLLLYFGRLWISPAPIVLTLFVAYPLWNWLRLDAAVDFIRAQLVNLESENQQVATAGSWADMERTVGFLQSLGHVSQWQWALLDKGSDSTRHPESWRHEISRSSRIFSVGNESRRLNLDWQPGHEFVAARLQQIFPPEDEHTDAPGSGADVVNLNLVALDNAYAQARRNRDLVNGTLEQLESAVILSELSGEILLVNEQARMLLGVEEDCKDLLWAMSKIELVEKQDVQDLVNQLIFRGLHFDHEGMALATGREILCRGGVINLDRPMLLIVMMDVSDLKKMEKRRTEALNFLSHDLRAPLTSVLALIESAKMEQPGEHDMALLGEIETYIEKNLSYAENFIQLAKLEQDDSPRFDDCDAPSLIDNAVAQLFHGAKKRGVELRISYCDESVWLRCNRGLLERALINLIDNALKHSGSGSKVMIELGCDAEYAIFSVSDQGRGIASGDMDRIFEKFQQGDSASSGVGLGLRFVSAVARSHGGDIAVRNNNAGGACFTLRVLRESEEF